MAILVGFLLLSGALIVQSAILSQMQLLQGTLDLVFLVVISWSLVEKENSAWAWALIGGILVGYMSGLPIWAPPIAYLLATAGALFLKTRVWQVPILALLTATFAGSLIVQTVSYAALQIQGVPLALGDAINLVALPSTLLNLIGAIPVSALVREISILIFPREYDEE